MREHVAVYTGVGKPYFKSFKLRFGHTGELMDCVVPKDDVLVFIPDGYEAFLRLPRSFVYIQGNPDGKNTGYE